jgi:peptidoglycan/xylan/chitin deacetylase (PgdA/CDA1 family)
MSMVLYDIKKMLFRNKVMRKALWSIPIPIPIPFVGYYHLVSDQNAPHIKNLYAYKTIEQFKNDCDYILRHFYPMNLIEIIKYLKADEMLPLNAFLLTFDDGLREVYDIIAPILLEKGIPATFFISSAFIDNKKLAHDHKASLIVERLKTGRIPTSMKSDLLEILMLRGTDITNIEFIAKIDYQHRNVIDEIGVLLGLDFLQFLEHDQPYLTTEHIRQMIKMGFAIGSHGIDHPLYSALSPVQQLHQTIDSLKFIREKFDLNYGAFAFPHNDLGVSEDFFKEVKKSGIVDITFGTAGIIEDVVQNHLQRFSLEKPLIPAQQIFAFQVARRLFMICKGCRKVFRSSFPGKL